MSQQILGWANEGFGQDPWGGALIGGSEFQGAVAIAENVIRCYFTEAIFLSGLLETIDASTASHWDVEVVAGTVGLDGNATRPVTVLYAQIGFDTNSIDLVLDRPMTPAPSQYTVTASGLVTQATQTPLATATVQLPGIYRSIVRPSVGAASPSQDLANPQTLSALAGTTPLPPSASLLGTFVTDDTADYALDSGLISYKKRVLRRGITSPGGFAHLPGYGVGIPSYGKKLASAAVRNQLAAAWQSQILQEPETLTATVAAVTPDGFPNLCFFVVNATMKGGGAVRVQVPFPIN